MSIVAALVLTVAPFASDAYVADRAHTSVVSTNVLELYNVTVPGEEVDALPEPTSGGFEYWPYVYDEATGSHPSPYPDDVQWGYRAGSDAAKRCMKLSWHIWKYVQDNMPEHLAALAQYDDAPSSYYHWNNDYTNARTEEVGYRSFWHYNRPSGLLKWISHTRMDGSCQHPTVEAIDRWAQCEGLKLSNAADQCPGHR
jgi:hypothetical protein